MPFNDILTLLQYWDPNIAEIAQQWANQCQYYNDANNVVPGKQVFFFQKELYILRTYLIGKHQKAKSV